MSKKADIAAAMKAQIAKPADKFSRADVVMADVTELRPNVDQPGAPRSERPRKTSTDELAGRDSTAAVAAPAARATAQKNFSIPLDDLELVQKVRGRAASEEAGGHILTQSEALRLALRAALAIPPSELGALVADLERLKPGPKPGTRRTKR